MELKRLGFEVALFERSRLLGGKATSFSVGGVEVDNGQHVYLACCTELINFVEQAGDGADGMGHVLFLQDRFDALLLARGKPPARLRAASLPAPWHLSFALLRYRYLTPLQRLQVGRAVLRARTSPRDGETFAAWLDRQHQSPEARRAFWDPFMVPALNAPLEAVSAESALFTIATAFLSDAGAARFGYALVPLARIAEAAAGTLDRVELRCPVVGLDIDHRSPGRPVLRGIVLEDGSWAPFDAVVLALPPSRLMRVLDEPEAFGLAGLDLFQPAAIVDVHLWYDLAPLGGSLPALGETRFAALLDSPVQWVFEKAPGYLCCSMSAADHYVSWTGEKLVELCRAELAAVIPELEAARFLRGAATRDREATFVPSPGLLRPGPATTCPRVFIAGAWTDTGWPATMESAVRSGRAAARALAARTEGQSEERDG